MRTRLEHPTQGEVEILQIIWRQGPSTVRQVRDSLAESRHVAFSTVSTLMNIMVKKGLLSAEPRKNKGGAIYSAKVARAGTAAQMLKDWARHLFGSSVSSAIQTLASEGEIDPEELADLRKAIDIQSSSKRTR